MHELLLSRATLPEPTVIQRTSLLPYSLGHALCLLRESNAFVCGGTPMRKDVLQAVWICANTWKENTQAHNQWLAVRKFKIISKRFEKADISLCIQAIREYIAGGSLEFPLSDIPRPVDRNSHTRRPPGSPFILMLHHFLCTHYRLSISDAWNFPVGEAKMRWACHWEQEGGLDIWNSHDESFKSYVEKREREKAELAAKQKGAS